MYNNQFNAAPSQYVNQQTGVVIDTTYWRQDPWSSQEVQHLFPGYPACLEKLQDRLERQLRLVLQQHATDSQARAYLYHQMAYNNYNNQNWEKLVVSTAQLTEAMVMSRGVQLTDDAIGNFIGRAIQAYLVRAVENDTGLQASLNAQQQQAVMAMAQQRNSDVAVVEEYQRSLHGVMPQQQTYAQGYPQAQQPNNFLTGQLRNGITLGVNQGMGTSFMPTPAPQSNVNFGLRQAAPYNAPATQVQPPQPVRNDFNSYGSPLTAISRSAPQQTPAPTPASSPYLEEVRLSPDNGYHHQRGGEDIRFEDHFVPSDEPSIFSTPKTEDLVQIMNTWSPRLARERAARGINPKIMLCGRLRPIAYNCYTHYVTDSGELMKYEEHVLNIVDIEPEGDGKKILPLYYEATIEKKDTALVVEEDGLKRNWLVEEKKESLQTPIIGMKLPEAFNFVDYRENSFYTKAVVDFVRTTTEGVMVSGAGEFRTQFPGLELGAEKLSYDELLAAMRNIDMHSHALWAKLDERATEACNEILNKRLSLGVSIGSYTADWEEILQVLETDPEFGPKFTARFLAHFDLIHDAVCSIAGGTLHSSMLKHNAMFQALNSAAGVVRDDDTHQIIPASREVRQAAEEYLKTIEHPMGFKNDLVQVISNDFCSLIPTEFAALGLALAEDEDTTIIYPSAMPVVAELIADTIKRAGGFKSGYRRFILGTVDGVMLQIHPTPGSHDGQTIVAVEVITE